MHHFLRVILSNILSALNYSDILVAVEDEKVIGMAANYYRTVKSGNIAVQEMRFRVV